MLLRYFSIEEWKFFMNCLSVYIKNADKPVSEADITELVN